MNIETDLRAGVMRVIRGAPAAITCKAIAERLGVSPPTVSPVLRALRKAGKIRSAGNTRGTTYVAA